MLSKVSTVILLPGLACAFLTPMPRAMHSGKKDLTELIFLFMLDE